MTLAIMSRAMNRLAKGSKPVQPVRRMRMVEMITPTEPRVSCNVSDKSGNVGRTTHG